MGIIISSVYSLDKEKQQDQVKSSLDNIYLKKTIKEITENLEPRYEIIIYKSMSGDTYESILNKLNIDIDEKKLLLNTILNEKSLKKMKFFLLNLK
jgi:hypothetical protein